MSRFTEVLFRRVEEKTGIDRDTQVKVTFQRVRENRKVNVTPQEADMLNAGKLTHPGNTEFIYLLAEGQADPAPQILGFQSADSEALKEIRKQQSAK